MYFLFIFGMKLLVIRGGIIMKKLFIMLIIFVLAFVGCTRTEKHLATGAVVGAVAGQVIGASTAATVIGAGVGTAAGAIIDKQTK